MFDIRDHGGSYGGGKYKPNKVITNADYKKITWGGKVVDVADSNFTYLTAMGYLPNTKKIHVVNSSLMRVFDLDLTQVSTYNISSTYAPGMYASVTDEANGIMWGYVGKNFVKINLNAQTYSLIKTYDYSISKIFLGPDGYIYLSLSSNSIIKVDGTGSIIKMFTLGYTANDLFVDEDLNVYVFSNSTKSVEKLDQNGNSLWSVPYSSSYSFAGHGLRYSKTRNCFYALGNGNNNVIVISAVDGSLIKTVISSTWGGGTNYELTMFGDCIFVFGSPSTLYCLGLDLNLIWSSTGYANGQTVGSILVDDYIFAIAYFASSSVGSFVKGNAYDKIQLL